MTVTMTTMTVTMTTMTVTMTRGRGRSRSRKFQKWAAPATLLEGKIRIPLQPLCVFDGVMQRAHTTSLHLMKT